MNFFEKFVQFNIYIMKLKNFNNIFKNPYKKLIFSSCQVDVTP